MTAVQKLHDAYTAFNQMNTIKQAAVVGGIGAGFSLVGGALGPHKVQRPSIAGTAMSVGVNAALWGGINGGFMLLQTGNKDAAIKAGVKWAAVGGAFVAGRAIGHAVDNAIGV